jgi:hypothetical protein
LRSGTIQICRKWTPFGARLIEFAVRDAGAGAHGQHLTSPHDRAEAHRVLVGQAHRSARRRTLGIDVLVRRKASAALDAIVIEKPQVRESDLLGILVWTERKGEVGVQPVELANTAIFRLRTSSITPPSQRTW